MAKGSQLSQLKSALAQAGVGQNPPGKKRKRFAPVEKDKEKKATKLDQRLNPFDVKVTKLKHDVGGRKLKGVTGKPAQSKQAGIEQRKKTLLKEYDERNRAGGIVDRRFGENDPNLSLEERMLERFTRERQRTSKGVTFNLGDEDELTHYGQSLSKLDDFDNIGLNSDEEEGEQTSGQIGRDIVSKTHFGGFSDDEEAVEPTRKKSKVEVMAEVVAKSKEYKLRRQMEREHEDNVRHELDTKFTSLRNLIFAPDPAASGSNSIPIGESQGHTFTSSNSMETAGLPMVPEIEDINYDQRVRELAFDKRSKPKDRTKTEQELALEVKETLEKAERRRQRRMLGLNESDNEEEGKRKGKRKRGAADDPADDFKEEMSEWDELGIGLGAKEDASVESDEEETSGESGGNHEEVCGDVASEHDSGDLGVKEGEHEELLQSGKTRKNTGNAKQKSSMDLPYTFPCPTNHGEFLQIVEDIDETDIPTVVQRIRALYHTSISPDNKFKLQALGNVLIDNILYVGSSAQPQLGLITSLYSHLNAIIQAYPVPAAQHFNEKITLMHKNLKRGLARGPLNPDSKTWPGLPELSLLRVIGKIWSTSDLNHGVISPTRVLIGSYLGLCRVRSLSDLASGLFLCTLYLQYESLSKRLVPEVINFLINTILHLAPHDFKNTASLPGSFPSPDFQSELCQTLRLKPRARQALHFQPPNLPQLLTSGYYDEQAKSDLLCLSFELLGLFGDIYKGLDGFTELYEPIISVLDGINSECLVEAHRAKLFKLLEALQRLVKFSRQSRQPLRLQSHKPIPIPTYIPKFETASSNFFRRQDPDYEKNEASKLRNQFKQERKGAIRELRKDARFLGAVEQRNHVEKDRFYNESMKRVFGSIEGERAEQKAMEREKAKEKRRAGKR